MVLETVDATCEPSETPTVGALIERVPDVSVKEAGVEAPTGTTMPIMPMLKALSATEKKTVLRSMKCPISRIESEATLWHPWAA